MSLISKVRRRESDRGQAMTLVEHLEELRTRLLISLGAIGLGSVVGWFLYNPLVRLLLNPYCNYWESIPQRYRPTKGCTLFFNGAIDGVMIKLKAIVFLGLAVALPIVLYQLWAFIVPGLTQKERRYALPFVFASTVLFLAGA